MKKINKLMVIFILILLVVLTALYGTSQYNTKKSLDDYWYGDENKTINASEILRCSFSLFRPDVAFVSDHVLLDDIDEMKVYFYKIMNIFSKEEDNREFIGVTTIKNTTFPQLVAMVKKDCSQFQEDYDNPDSKGIDWGYREAEPPKTEEQIENKIMAEIYNMRTGLLAHLELNFNIDQKARFIEFYGDMENMPFEEQLDVAKRVVDDGGIDLGVLGEDW